MIPPYPTQHTHTHPIHRYQRHNKTPPTRTAQRRGQQEKDAGVGSDNVKIITLYITYF